MTTKKEIPVTASAIDPKALEAAARALALQASVSEMEAHGYNGIHAREYADEWWRSHLDRARAAISAHIAATPSDELWIGEYMLRRGPTGIWIGRPGGEGGEFAAENLEHVIAEFYRENF